MQGNKNYSGFSELDFAEDEYFQEWVLRQASDNKKFWDKFVAANPDKQEAIDKAIAIIRSIWFKEEWPQDEVVERSLGKSLDSINKRYGSRHKVVPMRRWWAAAAILLLLAAGSYFLINQNGHQSVHQVTEKSPEQDFAPGGNKAVLTLADGSTIILDSVQNGLLSKQGNANVIKLQNGKVAYQKERDVHNGKIEYNTISTPRGGQYQLELADGSKVWLNAASSITFPSTFTGNERQVKITGEAYFEVAHNSKMPFRVSVIDIQVKVLGTHFNINAYLDDNDIKTTLLEGSVKVDKGVKSVIIKPGEQVVIKNGDNKLSVKEGVDLGEVIAWKNGFFSFRHSCIKDITKQLSRWYDIQVVYDDDIENQEFTGKIDRTLKLSEVLRILEKTGVRFKIEEGRKLTILP